VGDDGSEQPLPDLPQADDQPEDTPKATAKKAKA